MECDGGWKVMGLLREMARKGLSNRRAFGRKSWSPGNSHCGSSGLEPDEGVPVGARRVKDSVLLRGVGRTFGSDLALLWQASGYSLDLTPSQGTVADWAQIPCCCGWYRPAVAATAPIRPPSLDPVAWERPMPWVQP